MGSTDFIKNRHLVPLGMPGSMRCPAGSPEGQRTPTGDVVGALCGSLRYPEHLRPLQTPDCEKSSYLSLHTQHTCLSVCRNTRSIILLPTVHLVRGILKQSQQDSWRMKASLLSVVRVWQKYHPVMRTNKLSALLPVWDCIRGRNREGGRKFEAFYLVGDRGL